jgi:hypothetical protein
VGSRVVRPEEFSKEEGYFHLTPAGWVRVDQTPFPPERVETWSYREEQSSPSAKEQVKLTRIWVAGGMNESKRAQLHARYGEPICPTIDRSVLLTCRM